MSARLKLWLVALGFLGLLIGSNLWLRASLTSTREDLAATQVQVDTLTASVEALRGRLGGITTGLSALQERNLKNERSIKSAMDQNRDWADHPVPDAVSDGLCGAIRCTPRD